MDWTDKADGGCVEMTGCVSICVKNLAKVAKVTEWVGREGEYNNDLLFGDIFSLYVFPLIFFYITYISSFL